LRTLIISTKCLPACLQAGATR